jgi:predicted nucleic acid-binding protein
MSVLVDSSVWIEYFRGGTQTTIDSLIDENLVVVNDLILSELLPPLHLRRQRRLTSILKEVKKHPIQVDWDDIVQTQITCLRNGINKVGIPDLIIAQNAMQNGLQLLSRDKHFEQLSKLLPLTMY